MGTKLRVLGFGALSGLVWVAAPLSVFLFLGEGGSTDGLARELVHTLLPGVLTGVVVSALLALPLLRSGRWLTVLLGLLALPVGTFTYGATADWLMGIVARFDPHAQFYVGSPFWTGYLSMMIGSFSLFSVVLYPASVVTTFWLRRVVRRDLCDGQRHLPCEAEPAAQERDGL